MNVFQFLFKDLEITMVNFEPLSVIWEIKPFDIHLKRGAVASMGLLKVQRVIDCFLCP